MYWYYCSFGYLPFIPFLPAHLITDTKPVKCYSFRLQLLYSLLHVLYAECQVCSNFKLRKWK
jgi:hypothetical protein